MKKHLIKLFALALTVSLMYACDPDDPITPDAPSSDYSDGVFITCEGPFGSGSGTLSFINRSNGKVYNDLFEKINKRPLGNIVQSISLYNKKAYIVVNNANKVEVVDAATLKSIGYIGNVSLPRYFIGVSSSTGYVSCWDNTIAVINLSDLSVKKKITVQEGPEKMLLNKGKVWVLNIGGFSNDSLISIIDTQTETVVHTLSVHYRPSGIVKDKNGNLWVMCNGKGFNGYPQSDDTKGHLLCINPDNYSILADFVFPSAQSHPDKLTINENGEVLYFLYEGGIYSMNITDTALPQTPFVSKLFYNLMYDAKMKAVYAADPVDYSQPGWVFRYKITSPVKVDSFKVGVIPGEFWVN